MIPTLDYAVQPGSQRPCCALAFEGAFLFYNSWCRLPSRPEVSLSVTPMQTWHKAGLDFLCRLALTNRVKATKLIPRIDNVNGTRAAQRILNSESRRSTDSGVLPIFSVDFMHFNHQNVPASVYKSYTAKTAVAPL